MLILTVRHTSGGDALSWFLPTHAMMIHDVLNLHLTELQWGDASHYGNRCMSAGDKVLTGSTGIVRCLLSTNRAVAAVHISLRPFKRTITAIRFWKLLVPLFGGFFCHFFPSIFKPPQRTPGEQGGLPLFKCLHASRDLWDHFATAVSLGWGTGSRAIQMWSETAWLTTKSATQWKQLGSNLTSFLLYSPPFATSKPRLSSFTVWSWDYDTKGLVSTSWMCWSHRDPPRANDVSTSWDADQMALNHCWDLVQIKQFMARLPWLVGVGNFKRFTFGKKLGGSSAVAKKSPAIHGFLCVMPYPSVPPKKPWAFRLLEV